MQKGGWYARVGGRVLSLGVADPTARRAAYAAWHRLTADGGRPLPPAPAPEPEQPDTVRRVADLFLADCRDRLKPATCDRYAVDLGRLCAVVGRQSVAAVTADTLSRWLCGWAVGSTTKGIVLRSVSAFFGWAVRHKLLTVNPTTDVPKPKSRSRSAEAVIGEADHGQLLAAANPQLRDVLRVLYATGCRPGELCRMTADSFDRSTGTVILHEHKADRTGRPRLVCLPADVAELLAERSARYPSGPLFRSRAGVPWSPKQLGRAVRRLRLRVGVAATAYGYRHTFATDALAAGVPDAVVASLLGHSSTAMLHRHYAHLTARSAVLRAAVGQVRGGAVQPPAASDCNARPK